MKKWFYTIAFCFVLLEGCNLSINTKAGFPHVNGIRYNPATTLVTCGDTVSLSVDITGSDRNDLVYSWQCSHGFLAGKKDQTVSWIAPGYQTEAEITVYISSNQDQFWQSASLNFTVNPVPEADPPGYIQLEGKSSGRWPRYEIVNPTVQICLGIDFIADDNGSSTFSLKAGKLYFISAALSVMATAGQTVIPYLQLQTNAAGSWQGLVSATDEGHRGGTSFTYLYRPAVNCKIRFVNGIYQASASANSHLHITILEMS